MNWLAAVAVASLLLAGCASEGAEIATATTSSVAAPALAVAAWDGMPVDIICLAGSEVYEGIPESHRPIMAAVAGAVDDDRRDEVGARVGAMDCDVTITFDLEGQPFEQTYSGSAVGSMYTGALVEGTITLSADGHEPMAVDLTDRIDPPESFMLPEWQEPPREPEDAPFWQTVKDGMCGAFAGWFEGIDLTELLKKVRGSWPPRGDDCGGYAESGAPFGDLGS